MSFLFYLIKVIEHLILPPGLFFFLTLVLAGVMYTKKHRNIGRALGFLALIIYLGTTPMVGNTLLRPLEKSFSPPDIMHTTGDVIVVLGAGFSVGTPAIDGTGDLTGDSAARLLTAAELYKKLHKPIILSGGPLIHFRGESVSMAEIGKRDLVNLGIPKADIYTDETSRNTQENAANTKQLMQQHGFRHPILVTSAYHMKRAVLDFKEVHVTVTPFPTDYEVSKQASLYDVTWLPSSDGLASTATAIKEYLGIWATQKGVHG